MKAAIFKGPGELALEEVADPTVGPGEVLYKVGANTVCGTDLRILRGEKSKGIDRGVILGHEIAGEVVEVGAGVTNYKVGDRFAVIPSVTCGRCWFCKHGEEHFCEQVDLFGYRINGGLAEYGVLPARAVERGNAIVSHSADLPFEHMALMEPLSCVLNGRENYQQQLGDTVVVMGAGPIGLLHTALARIGGASNVIVSDLSAERREIALGLGATHAVDPTQQPLGDLARDLTGGRGADVAVICIGRGELFVDALNLVRKGGRVNAFAGFKAGGSVEFDPNLIHYGEIDVTGTSNSRRDHGEAAMRLLESGVLDASKIVTHQFSLDQVVEAIEFTGSGQGVKVAVKP
ncbi:alcohol dehydrogenase catalytic domain-containing protein [Propionibacteriaceae bacterium G57]|uniref:alcohol dehydrogenase catalytic domain-containing protein n=1 Tax=Aestuariimicrobium sp. G57 TaxID=3418485 RepID=UPI003DA6DC56